MFTNKDKERIAELKTQVAEAEARIEAQDAEKIRLQAEIERVEDELLTVRAATQKAQRLAKESEVKLSAINAQLAANNDKLATFDAEVEKAAAARFAGLGGDPLPESGGSNTEFSGLTGLARAQAIHKAQAKQSNPSNQ